MAYTSIDNPALYFQTKLYTGNATDDTAITFDVTDTSMQPALIWIKNRSTTDSHHWVSVPGTGVAKRLRTDTTGAIGDQSDGVKSIQSNGFTIGTTGSLNGNGNSIVAWCWKEDATAGFDIVSFTGNSSTQDISHSLSAVPHWILVKNRADATNWAVYHKGNTSAPETEIIYLNADNATSDDSAFFGDTAPTSSQFRVGGDNGVNGNGDSMIAYVWSEKKGYSKFGSYTGNGDADGTFVYTGFRPAWILIKRSSSGTMDWILHDNKRAGFNVNDDYLIANTNSAEITGNSFRSLDILSNGFKLRGTQAETNESGETYIYMAFAESPFVNSKGIPTNAR
jgi:hypothetical protein